MHRHLLCHVCYIWALRGILEQRENEESQTGEVEVGIRATADEVKLSPIAEKIKVRLQKKSRSISMFISKVIVININLGYLPITN